MSPTAPTTKRPSSPATRRRWPTPCRPGSARKARRGQHATRPCQRPKWAKAWLTAFADSTLALAQASAGLWQTVSIAASVAGDAQAHITEETDREVIGWEDYATYAQVSANADAVRGAAAAQAAASLIPAGQRTSTT